MYKLLIAGATSLALVSLPAPVSAHSYGYRVCGYDYYGYYRCVRTGYYYQPYYGYHQPYYGYYQPYYGYYQPYYYSPGIYLNFGFGHRYHGSYGHHRR